ncbi:AbrB family transcriptional regulator [Ruegeria arenilitoris]|uniref:AbrB family transcriptional regulator n=1 Tax=Ruegeria arenilitoris TaxID=1173585 RepID=UPI0020C42825|nr:AbrB family transcriptional regulator [Ruegeria arenilitoris]
MTKCDDVDLRRSYGASILAPIIQTAALSLGDFLPTRPLREAILAAQFIIGCGICVKFVGVTWVELRRVVAAGFVYVIVLAILATAFFAFVTALDFGQPVEAFMAVAPPMDRPR